SAANVMAMTRRTQSTASPLPVAPRRIMAARDPARDAPRRAEGAPPRPPRRRLAPRNRHRARAGPGVHGPADDRSARARTVVPRERGVGVPRALPARLRA